MRQLILERFLLENDFSNEKIFRNTCTDDETELLWKTAISSDIRNGDTESTLQLLKYGSCLPEDIIRILNVEMILEVGREDILQLILEGIFVDVIAAKEEISGERIVLSADFLEPVKKEIAIEDKNIIVHEFVCQTQIRTNDMCVERIRKRLAGTGICCFYQQNKERVEYNLCFFYSSEPKAILWYYKPFSLYYELTTALIREQIEQWDQKYGVEILGAGADGVELRLLHLECGINEFQWEAIGFCPQLALPKDFRKAYRMNLDNSVEIRFLWK